MSDLTMLRFLRTVDKHDIRTLEQLISEGYHPKVIVAKAEKAERKGYIDYGVAVHRPWLTDEGRAFLREAG